MVVTCEVKFDNNPNAIFFAGQVICMWIVRKGFICDKKVFL